jgi:enoyl-CoA hydratase/carnithine racemase
MGLVAEDGGAVIFWPLLIDVNRAKDFLMRARIISGAEAFQHGIINYAVPADKVLEEAIMAPPQFALIEQIDGRISEFLSAVVRSCYALAHRAYQPDQAQQRLCHPSRTTGPALWPKPGWHYQDQGPAWN